MATKLESGIYESYEPYNQAKLKVSDIHEICYYEFGNPEGTPVIYLHGGPGGGIDFSSSKYFDKDLFRVVMFDQRGCGRSTPFAELRENDTPSMIADIEAIRELLGIDKWVVFGGSWGSTLSLAYAIENPSRCLSLVLRGIFLGTQREIEHLYLDGASRFFPEEHERFLAPLSEDERKNLIQSYYNRLCSDQKHVREEAASAWSRWEASILRLVPDADSIASMEDPAFAVAFARIECHYFIHKCFFTSSDYILENCRAIADIPTYIVHGRYDVICAPIEAYRLHKMLPKSKLVFVKDAGHSASEPDTARTLVNFMGEVINTL